MKPPSKPSRSFPSIALVAALLALGAPALGQVVRGNPVVGPRRTEAPIQGLGGPTTGTGSSDSVKTSEPPPELD